MIRSFSSLLLILLSLHTVSGQCFAESRAEKEARHIEKIRQGILKLGVGESARLVIKLRDKTKVAGFIREAGEGSFVVTDIKTGKSTEVAYADVTQVKGQNLSTGAKVIIGVGIALAVLFIILYALNAGGIRVS
jgi:hypothetical protein